MTFHISNIANRGSIRWIVLAMFMVGTIFGATAIASAELSGTETEFYNQTTEIDNTTTEIEVTVDGTNGANVYANFYRIADDADSTETLESEDMILNASTGETANATWAIDTDNTAAYRVVVHDNGDGLAASEVGNINVAALSGGGSGFFTDANGDPDYLMIGGFLAVVLGAAALVGDD